MDDWGKHKRELLKDPEFKRLIDESRVEFEIARAVIAARIKRKLTQKQLARKIKTGQSVISRLESAGSTPSISLLKRVAKALDTSLQVQLR